MNITKVQIHINAPDNNVKAFADIIVDNEFIIKGLAIRLDREEFAFVTMPYRTRNDGTRMDTAHPLNEPCRRYIEDKVLDAYEAELQRLYNKETNHAELV